MAEKKKPHPNSLKNLKSAAEVKADYERLTDEQKHERMSKLGKASAQKKRDTRTLKEIMLELLASEAPEEDIKKYGLPAGASNSMVMSAAAARKAREGDLKALEIVRDTAGQMPTKEVALTAEVFTDADKKLLDKVAKRVKETTEE